MITESFGTMTFKSLDNEKVTLRNDPKICNEIDTATFSDKGPSLYYVRLF